SSARRNASHRRSSWSAAGVPVGCGRCASGAPRTTSSATARPTSPSSPAPSGERTRTHAHRVLEGKASSELLTREELERRLVELFGVFVKARVRQVLEDHELGVLDA